MGTPLTGTSVASSYQSILKIGDNSPLGTTIKQLSDGAGNDVNIWLEQNYIEFRQYLNISPVTSNGVAQITFRTYSALNPGTQNSVISVASDAVSGGASVSSMQVGSELDQLVLSVNGSRKGTNYLSRLSGVVYCNAAGIVLPNQSVPALPTLGANDKGLTVFDTNVNKFRGWTGTAWVDFH
jgi:hypothetical protein